MDVHVPLNNVIAGLLAYRWLTSSNRPLLAALSRFLRAARTQRGVGTSVGHPPPSVLARRKFRRRVNEIRKEYEYICREDYIYFIERLLIVEEKKKKKYNTKIV